MCYPDGWDLTPNSLNKRPFCGKFHQTWVSLAKINKRLLKTGNFLPKFMMKLGTKANLAIRS